MRSVCTVQVLDDFRDKKSRRPPVEAEPGRLVIQYMPEEFRDCSHVGIVHNGEALTLEQAGKRIVFAGDEVLFYVIPGDPLTSTGFLIFAIVSLILVAGSAVYSIYSALTAPSLKGRKDIEDSDTYGFDALSNTVRPGTRIPIVYGTHRIGGHIIQQFLRPSRKDSSIGELQTLLGLCSGPIESISDIRVDKNPVANYGSDVLPDTRLGLNHQEPINGFNDVVTQRTQDVEVTQAGGAETFTTSQEVDRFQVVFRFPVGLFKINSNGATLKNRMRMKVEYRELLDGTNPWQLVDDFPVERASKNPFDHFLDSPDLERARYEIRVTRQTPDDTSVNAFSQVSVIAINEILADGLTYPRIALLAVSQLPTNQVSGRPPQYDSIVKGRLVRVYTDLSTFTEEWSDNPAWCLLDLLTSDFDGLGPFIKDTHIDLQSFLDWAAFCDLMVAKDDSGVLEKQFRLNIVLDGSLNAAEAIQQLCSTGRAFFLHRGDKWAVRADKEENPVQLFTMGRISKGSFSVVREAQRSKANFIVGDFWNEEIDYEPDSLPKEDPTIDVDGDQIDGAMNLLGTTSASQANRLLNYHMLANRLQRRTIEFETGVEALACEAGDVVRISHDVPAWGRSGRLLEADSTGTTLILDRQVTIEAGKQYELTVLHANDVVDVVRVTNQTEASTNRLSVSPDWTTLPLAGKDYAFGEITKSTTLYRIVSITRGSLFLRRKVRAKEYNPAVYGTDLTVLPAPSVSALPDPNRIPPDATELRLNERIEYAEDGTLQAAIDAHFTLPAVPMIRAQLFWREVEDISWTPGPIVDDGYATLTQGIQSPGFSYEVSIVTLAANGNRKHADLGLRGTISTVGTLRRPDKVAGFTVNRTLDGLFFQWLPLDPVVNFDLDHYEIRAGASWETALKLADDVRGTVFETSAFVSGTQTYLIKAWNTAGKDSAEAAAVVMVVDPRIGENVVFTRQEDNTFPGTKLNFTVVSNELVLQTESAVAAFRLAILQASGGSGFLPGGFGVSFAVAGTYTTAAFQVTSLNAVRALISTVLESTQVDASLFWSASELADETWLGEFARTRQWAVAPEGSVTVKVEMRFSVTDSNEGSFGVWQERLQNIEATVKWAQARIQVTVRDPSFTVKIQKFRILFDVPDVTDSGTVTTSAAGTAPVTFAKDYNNAPKVAVSVLGATAGDTPKHSNVTNAGFDMEVFDSGGTRVVRTVHWVSNGF